MLEELDYYNEKETRRIIRWNKNLYIADNGSEEVIIRLKDIPDFIMDVNLRIESTDFKFFRVNNTEYEPEITTKGIFLDRIKPKLRQRIINRLVKLQLGEIQPRKYKVIDVDMYDDIVDARENRFKKIAKDDVDFVIIEFKKGDWYEVYSRGS